jgi:TonB family protein
MNSQRAGIVTSVAIHSGILLLLLSIPTIKMLPDVQTILIAFEQSAGSFSSNQNEIKQTTDLKAVHRIRNIQPKPDHKSVPGQKETLQQVAATEHYPQVATPPVSLDNGKLMAMSSKGTEDVAILNSNYRGNTDGNVRNAKKTETQNIAVTNFGMTGAPSFMHRELPVYPIIARRLGKEGKVVLELLINAMGKLQNVEVIEQAGYGFTEAAIEAVKKSTYVPALRDGEKVTSRALLPVRFKLQ